MRAVCLGIPGRIVEIDREAEAFPCAVVDYGGVRKRAWLAYVPEAGVGDYVIVHVGFAIAMMDEAEAKRTLDVLRAMTDAVESELGEALP